MPTLVTTRSCSLTGNTTTPTTNLKDIVRSNADSSVQSRQKRILRSDAARMQQESPFSSPTKWKSPRRCLTSSPNTPPNGSEKASTDKQVKLCKTPVKQLLGSFAAKSSWNPKDPQQMNAVKEALHVSTVLSNVVCREAEQKRVLEFCQRCIQHEKAGSLYVCGCPGTGKSLSMEKVKHLLLDWAQEAGYQGPDILMLNCTSLSTTSDIFNKILGKAQPGKRVNNTTSALQSLQKLYSEKEQSVGKKMMIVIADELDYLITKDRAVLHEFFMLTTFPFSRCILIGIANAIDLADRFLLRLQSMNCKPLIVTFHAYSKDQILKIIQERLMALPYTIFHPKALELCSRKVAAASGDVRKALSICRSAIDILEAELKELGAMNSSSVYDESLCQQTTSDLDLKGRHETLMVRIDHMALALSRTFRSPVVDTIQSLPQHQQIVLCSAVKHFHGRKKDASAGELYGSYVEVCKSSLIPAAGVFEFSSMCSVLNDQGLLKLVQSRGDKSQRVSLKIDEADITFALRGVRFFRKFLSGLPK